MGLEKARVTARTRWLRGPGRHRGSRARREARNGAASALEAKVLKNAHGVGNGVEALRHRYIALSCEPATEGRKCLAGSSRERPRAARSQAEQSEQPGAGHRCSQTRLSQLQRAARRALHPKLARLGCRSLVHGGQTLEADAGRMRLTAPGVVQLEAAMVECWLLAANVIKPDPCWRCTQSRAIPHA